MGSGRPRSALAVIVIAVLMIGGLAYDLIRSQARARTSIEAEFGGRAALAARLSAAALEAGTNNPTALAKEFGGPPATMRAALTGVDGAGPGTEVEIVDDRGRTLLASPASAAPGIRALVGGRRLRNALEGHQQITDAIRMGDRSRPMIGVLTPFASPAGRRVVIELIDAQEISAFASGFLASAPAVRGGTAYLVDGSGRVLASSTSARQGIQIPDRALASAVAGRRSGDVGGLYFAVAPIGTGTRWSVVLAAPRSALLAPVEGSTRREAWLLFALFIVAVLALLAVGDSALRKSAQLGSARNREQAAQELAHERLHDSLTGLPNRALFLDRAELSLARARRTGFVTGVLFIDLDHFKRINDSLGHEVGDRLLVGLAERLKAAIRPQDTISRFGGDEFLVLCDELSEEDDVVRVASRLRAALDLPFDVADRSVHISCCIGIAIHSSCDAEVDAATLVRDADAAMYRVKSTGGGGVRVFDAELHADALRRLDTEVALRAAIEAHDLFVHYQPIVRLPGGGLKGVEALARWHRPVEGAVSPSEFISLAEECGLIAGIGRHVLEVAMADCREWWEETLLDDDFVLSVNVSPRQLVSEHFPHLVSELVESWPLPASALCLEITESAVVNDPIAAEHALAQLSRIGVQLAIDDFGVGLSSLKQLVRSLPIDMIKLDQSFVAEIEQVREHAVVAAVAPMATALGMAAVAEGVESREQAEELSKLGYPLAQGYLFGPPIGAPELRARLTTAAHADAGDSLIGLS